MERLLVLLLLIAPPAIAQQPPGSPDAPVGSSVRMTHDRAKGFLLRAAEQFPETDYSFRPTADVRTVAQQLGHIADTQNYFCSTALGEERPRQTNIEKTHSAKAPLLEALRESFAECERALSQSDEELLLPARRSNNSSPRLSLLILNASHNFEHYGNLVTYMRIRGMVPPSSQP